MIYKSFQRISINSVNGNELKVNCKENYASSKICNKLFKYIVDFKAFLRFNKL